MASPTKYTVDLKKSSGSFAVVNSYGGERFDGFISYEGSIIASLRNPLQSPVFFSGTSTIIEVTVSFVGSDIIFQIQCP